MLGHAGCAAATICGPRALRVARARSLRCSITLSTSSPPRSLPCAMYVSHLHAVQRAAACMHEFELFVRRRWRGPGIRSSERIWAGSRGISTAGRAPSRRAPRGFASRFGQPQSLRTYRTAKCKDCRRTTAREGFRHTGARGRKLRPFWNHWRGSKGHCTRWRRLEQVPVEPRRSLVSLGKLGLACSCGRVYANLIRLGSRTSATTAALQIASTP